MFANYPDVVDVPTMAKMLNIGRGMAYTLVSSGKVKSVRIGKKIRIPTIYIKDYIIKEAKFRENPDSKGI